MFSQNRSGTRSAGSASSDPAFHPLTPKLRVTWSDKMAWVEFPVAFQRNNFEEEKKTLQELRILSHVTLY